MSCEVRVLGPVTVCRDGTEIDVGHARQRILLAILAVRAGVATSTDRLIDLLWPRNPPRRARETLYSYLSRLRRILAGGDAAIERRAGGYLLDVDPSRVDMHRFRELVTRARSTRSIADWDAAMGLWRGEPFADFDVPQLDQVRATLDAEYFAAALDRNDVLLDAGDHARALPELREFSERYPWDERLAGQLMLVLYRCGRPSEAQDHYLDFRRRTIGERGTEPGAALTRLHRSILNMDPAIAAPVMGSAVAVPRQLPASFTGFAGRRTQLEQLDSARSQGARCVVVSGTAGVGKTSLAVRWAHAVAGDYPDGQLYTNLHGFGPDATPVSVDEVVRGFLDALGVSGVRTPVGVDAQVALYRSLVARRRLLVVLDNARDAEQVRPLLPGGEDCLTVVTSRNRLTGLVVTDGAKPVPVDTMSATDSRALLTNHFGTARLGEDSTDTDALVEACARLPLALNIVAARAVTNPGLTPGRLVDQLRDERTRLDRLQTGDDMSSIRAVFSWSYRALSPVAARLFRLLSLHPRGRIATEAAAALAGSAPEATTGPLSELVDAGLVSRQYPDFGFHDLMYEYAAELRRGRETEADIDVAVARLLNHFLRSAYRATRLAAPYRRAVPIDVSWSDAVASETTTGEEALAWLRARRPVLLAGVRLAAARGLHRCVVDLAWCVSDYLNRTRQCADAVEVQRLAVASATHLNDDAGRARAHRGMARGLTVLGRLDEAERELHASLSLYEELDDDGGRADVLSGFGFIAERLGDHRRGLAVTLRAVDLFRAGDHTHELIRELSNAGWFHAKLGDHESAAAFCHEALEMADRVGGDVNRPALWSSLGYIAYSQGEHRQSIEHYERALALDRRNPHERAHEAATLEYLAKVYEAMADHDRARSHRAEARAIAEELGLPTPSHTR